MNDLSIEPETPRLRAGLRPGREPFLSVIVPVLNEEAFIGETLEQLLAQRYDPRRYEVLVADGGSTDGRGPSSPATPGVIRRCACWKTRAGCRARAATSRFAPRAATSCCWWTGTVAWTTRGTWPRWRRRSPAAAPTAWAGRSRWT